MLKDQVILIFGSGRGIGKSIAEACAEQGARLGLAARSENEIREVASDLKKRFDSAVFFRSCDVSSEADVESFVHEAEKQLGATNGLVCAAGIYGSIGPIDETPPREWRKAIEINLIGTYNCIYAVSSGMKKRKSGKIVLFSGGGQGPIPNFSAYTSSKGGVWRLTETLGAELEPFGVYVNAVAPGNVNTRFLDDLLEAGEAKVGRELYQKSLKQKQDASLSSDQATDLVLHLLSGASKNLSGKIISAKWDDYRGIQDPTSVNHSDLFTMKRVVDSKGNTRAT